MGVDCRAANADEPEGVCHWSARKLEPIVLVWVAAVLLAFMALSHFVFHSAAAVKALAMAAIGFLVPLVPAVLSWVEYRMNEHELESRHVDPKKPREFATVCELDELSHVVPTRRGVKYYKTLGESSRLRRFWNMHVSDRFSGEIHVEKKDLEKVLEALAQWGVPIR